MGFRLFSFKGGVYPPGNKGLTQNKPIERAKVPSLVYIPLQQHSGAPCEAVVKPGDQVRLGQMIGQPKGFISAPVHSSVSGKVRSIVPFAAPQGNKVMTIVIENDGLDKIDESIKPREIDGISDQDIKRIVLDAGIVGMGGAGFPTHVKLSPPAEKDIEAIILNGAECEPYLTADYRLMVEQPEKIVLGLKILMKVLDAKLGYIGIEKNKPDAIALMHEAVKDEPNIEVKVLKTKYPHGCEKLLIQSITGKRVPSRALPMDVGVVVNNVATAAEIYHAVKNGMPSIERVVTVTGKGIKEPKNLMVRVGTLFKDLIEDCGGLSCDPGKIIIGGPMMGVAQYSLEVPVTKMTSGLVVFPIEEAMDEKTMPCIRCAKCVQACPMNLMPLEISAYSLRENYEVCDELNVLDCIECGSCSFSCPANRPLVQSIRIAKKEIIYKRKVSNN